MKVLVDCEESQAVCKAWLRQWLNNVVIKIRPVSKRGKTNFTKRFDRPRAGGNRERTRQMKNINLDMEEVQINVNYIISGLTKQIMNTAKDLEHLQKASTKVTLSSACATDFVTTLTKLIARINECKEE